MAQDPAPLAMRRQDVAFKEEVTTGTFEALAAVNAVTPIYNASMTYDSDLDPKPKNGASISSGGADVTLERASCAFTTRLYGKGAAGLPYYTSLWKACGFKFTAQVMTPKTEAVDTISLAHYFPGRRKKMAGAMGSATLIIENGRPALINWAFQGVKIGYDNTALGGVPAYDTTKAPRCVSIALTVGGTPYFVPRIEIAFTNTIHLRPSLNDDGYRAACIVDRTWRLRMSPEAVSGVYWPDAFKNRTELALACTIGTVNDNKFTIAIPKLEMTRDPTEEDREGVMADSIEFDLKKNLDAGDDEFSMSYVTGA